MRFLVGRRVVEADPAADAMLLADELPSVSRRWRSWPRPGNAIVARGERGAYGDLDALVDVGASRTS
jgi:hypothetical protein